MPPQVQAVVLVEDSALRRIALEVLAARGYAARATDRDGALAAIRDGHLVILEVGAAGLGCAELSAARAGATAARLIALVDPDDAESARAALAAGATDLLPRPFTAGTFDLHLAGIERAMERLRGIEAELRASSVSAAALLDALPDMVFRMTREGEFLAFHAESIDQLAAPPDQIIGRTAVDLLGPELGGRISEATERALASGEVQRLEYSIPLSGGRRDFEARIAATGADEVVAIVRDMTEPKLLQARLAVADRLAALGTLAAGVAHEVNNPLTYVLIGIESVLKDLRRGDDARFLVERLPVLVERLDGAMDGARRVRRIIADLRTLGRAEDTDENARGIDVRAALDAAAAMVDSEVRYRARVLREYRDVPEVEASPDRLTQVFVNLLLNAVHAMPEGDQASNFIRLRTERDELGRVVVEVEDSGSGIAGGDLDRIFDPFFTTKPVGGGTGLGLWICHSIVTGYGGEISARSRPGEGSTFRVVLPAAPERRAAVVDSDDDVPALADLGRVLVIDDDPQVVSSLKIVLEGVDVTVVTSGREALARLEHEQFSWIFCDLMMPDLTGMDVYDRVRAAGHGLEDRFIFMTGGAFTPRAREFVARVANPCLSKPFHPRQVLAALRQWKALPRPAGGC